LQPFTSHLKSLWGDTLYNFYKTGIPTHTLYLAHWPQFSLLGLP